MPHSNDPDNSKNLVYKRTEERIAVLEVRVSDHSEDIKQLMLSQKSLTQSLCTISNTLLQIKYTLIGAIGITLVLKYGWLQGLLAMLKIP